MLHQLNTVELLKIYAALFPFAPPLPSHRSKSTLVRRLEVMADELPEAEVFRSPTAAALIVALLERHIAVKEVVRVVRRRFPSWKGQARHVRAMNHALSVSGS